MATKIFSTLFLVTAVSVPVNSISSQHPPCLSCSFSDTNTLDQLATSTFTVAANVSIVCNDVRSICSSSTKVYAVNHHRQSQLDVSVSGKTSDGIETTDSIASWSIVSVTPSAIETFDLISLNFKKQPLTSTKSKLSKWSGNEQQLKESAIATKTEVVQSLSQLGYETSLRRLSGDMPIIIGTTESTIKTRYTGTPDIELATQWLIQECIKLGLDVTTQEFPVRSNVGSNVVCTKFGPARSETIVVGGHYDSTSEIPTVLAPGAIDNGSGAMGVLEMAKACANFEFQSTIVFVFFGGEEQGLYGSNHFVDEATRNGETFKAALVMDMVAYSDKFYGVTFECDTSIGCRELMDLAEPNFVTYARELQVRRTTISFGSDHVPFQRAGVPCFLSIELDDTDYPSYHKSTDTVANANYNQAIDILKGLVATLVDLAKLA